MCSHTVEEPGPPLYRKVIGLGLRGVIPAFGMHDQRSGDRVVIDAVAADRHRTVTDAFFRLEVSDLRRLLDIVRGAFVATIFCTVLGER
jgi:hypothetical protein